MRGIFCVCWTRSGEGPLTRSVEGSTKQLANLGVRIADAATEQVAFRHPEHPDWRHISFCLFATAPEKRDGEWHTRHAVAIRPGKIDRSPTGTGVSARLDHGHAPTILRCRRSLARRLPTQRHLAGREFLSLMYVGTPAFCAICAKIFVRTELAGAPGARFAPAREQREVYVRRPVHPFEHWRASRTSRGEEEAPREGQEA